MARKAVPLAKKVYSNDPDSIPTRTLPQGFTAAMAVGKGLAPEDKSLLADHLLDSGLQGAPALTYFAELLVYEAHGGDVPIPSKLSVFECDYVRDRVSLILGVRP